MSGSVRIPISADASSVVAAFQQIQEAIRRAGQEGRRLADLDLSHPELRGVADDIQRVQRNFAELQRVGRGGTVAAIRNIGEAAGGKPGQAVDALQWYRNRDKHLKDPEELQRHTENVGARILQGTSMAPQPAPRPQWQKAERPEAKEPERERRVDTPRLAPAPKGTEPAPAPEARQPETPAAQPPTQLPTQQPTQQPTHPKPENNQLFPGLFPSEPARPTQQPTQAPTQETTQPRVPSPPPSQPSQPARETPPAPSPRPQDGAGQPPAPPPPPPPAPPPAPPEPPQQPPKAPPAPASVPKPEWLVSAQKAPPKDVARSFELIDQAMQKAGIQSGKLADALKHPDFAGAAEELLKAQGQFEAFRRSVRGETGAALRQMATDAGGAGSQDMMEWWREHGRYFSSDRARANHQRQVGGAAFAGTSFAPAAPGGEGDGRAPSWLKRLDERIGNSRLGRMGGGGGGGRDEENASSAGGLGGVMGGGSGGSIARFALGMAGLQGIGNKIGQGISQAQDEAVANNRLLKALADGSNDFETLRGKVRDTAEAFTLTYGAAQGLTRAWVGKTSEKDEDRALRGVGIGAGMARGFGLEAEQVVPALAGAAKQGEDPRRFAEIWATTTARSGMSGRSEEVLNSLARWTETAGRQLSTGPQTGEFASAYTALNQGGRPGLTGEGAEQFLQRLNAAVRGGGSHGEASQHLTWQALSRYGIRDAWEQQRITEGGMFERIPRTDGSTEGRPTVGRAMWEQIRLMYGGSTTEDPANPQMRNRLHAALGNHFGGVGIRGGEAIDQMMRNGEYDRAAPMLSRLGDLGVQEKDLKWQALPQLAEILGESPEKLAARRDTLLQEHRGLNADDRTQLRAANGEDLRDTLAKVLATRGPAENAGSRHEGAETRFSNTLTSAGTAVVDPLSDLKDSISAFQPAIRKAGESFAEVYAANRSLVDTINRITSGEMGMSGPFSLRRWFGGEGFSGAPKTQPPPDAGTSPGLLARTWRRMTGGETNADREARGETAPTTTRETGPDGIAFERTPRTPREEGREPTWRARPRQPEGSAPAASAAPAAPAAAPAVTTTPLPEPGTPAGSAGLPERPEGAAPAEPGEPDPSVPGLNEPVPTAEPAPAPPFAGFNQPERQVIREVVRAPGIPPQGPPAPGTPAAPAAPVDRAAAPELVQRPPVEPVPGLTEPVGTVPGQPAPDRTAPAVAGAPRAVTPRFPEGAAEEPRPDLLPSGARMPAPRVSGTAPANGQVNAAAPSTPAPATGQDVSTNAPASFQLAPTEAAPAAPAAPRAPTGTPAPAGVIHAESPPPNGAPAEPPGRNFADRMRAFFGIKPQRADDNWRPMPGDPVPDGWVPPEQRAAARAPAQEKPPGILPDANRPTPSVRSSWTAAATAAAAPRETSSGVRQAYESAPQSPERPPAAEGVYQLSDEDLVDETAPAVSTTAVPVDRSAPPSGSVAPAPAQPAAPRGGLVSGPAPASRPVARPAPAAPRASGPRQVEENPPSSPASPTAAAGQAPAVPEDTTTGAPQPYNAQRVLAPVQPSADETGGGGGGGGGGPARGMVQQPVGSGGGAAPAQPSSSGGAAYRRPVSTPVAPSGQAPAAPASIRNAESGQAAPAPAVARTGDAPAAAQPASLPIRPPATTPPAGAPELGALSARYESRGDAGAFGRDSTGGASYGRYQIATQTGTFRRFMEDLRQHNPQHHAALEAAGGAAAAQRGDGSFRQAFRDLARNDPTFAKSQHDFIQRSHYDPVARASARAGMDLNGRSAALRDAVWSTAVQHGPGSERRQNGGIGILNRAVERAGGQGADDAAIIQELYRERRNHFSRSTPQERASVMRRFDQESRQALTRLAEERGAGPNVRQAAAPTTPAAPAAPPAAAVAADRAPTARQATVENATRPPDNAIRLPQAPLAQNDARRTDQRQAAAERPQFAMPSIMSERTAALLERYATQAPINRPAAPRQSVPPQPPALPPPPETRGAAPANPTQPQAGPNDPQPAGTDPFQALAPSMRPGMPVPPGENERRTAANGNTSVQIGGEFKVAPLEVRHVNSSNGEVTSTEHLPVTGVGPARAYGVNT